MLFALILAGGKGTRLYPLSRSNKPKQFLKIINNKSFIRNTIERITPLIGIDNIYIITNKDYKNLIIEDIPEMNEKNIITEPDNKETATCIAYAALKFSKMDKDAQMVVLPSDHFIDNNELFLDTISCGIEICERKRGLVTIGVPPLRPETGYGYIQFGEKISSKIPAFRVDRFTEKPNIEIVKDFISRDNFLWNTGIFIWRADTYLRELEKYLPKMYKCLIKIYQSIGEEDEEEVIKEQYSKIDGISVDFGILQKTRKAYVIRGGFKWDDIGSFSSISKFLNFHNSNSYIGNIYLNESENCSFIGEKKLIIGFGLKDLVVVDTGDVLLVMDKNREQEVKHLINNLKNNEEFKKYL
ncbi:MAG: mannose-1-phosphate guanylyltransferase [Oscillospiraceae bacterium]|nr:mannose-1-phosphate guanylyltransferase [Oscillospiraceae bacterium]